MRADRLRQMRKSREEVISVILQETVGLDSKARNLRKEATRINVLFKLESTQHLRSVSPYFLTPWRLEAQPSCAYAGLITSAY